MPKKKQKRALITGVGGQDGSYLAELLIKKGYDVPAIIIPCPLLKLENS